MARQRTTPQRCETLGYFYAAIHHSPAELTVNRHALLHHGGWMVEGERLSVELFPDGLE